MTTGVFFHEIFSRRDWIIIGNKFRNFPEAMEHTLWHNLGHDTCQGDYGDRGLTPEFYPRLVKEVIEILAEPYSASDSTVENISGSA